MELSLFEIKFATKNWNWKNAFIAEQIVASKKFDQNSLQEMYGAQ